MLRSVRRQIMYIFILVTVIPVLVVGAIAVSVLKKQMRERYEEQVEAENTRVKSILFDITLSLYNGCEPIVTWQAYRDLLSTEDFSKSDKTNHDSLTRSLASLKENTAAISSIAIYTDNPNIPEGTGISYMENHFEDQEWYQNTRNGEWNNWTCTMVPLNPTQEALELTLVRRINIGSSRYEAYLVMTVSTSYMRNRLIKTNSFLLASVDALPCFFSSEYRMMETDMPFEKDFEGGYYSYRGSMDIKGERAMTCITTLLPYKVSNKFYILSSDLEAYRQMERFSLLFVVLVAIVIAGTVIVIILFSSYLSDRILTLRTAMHQASMGDYNIIDEFRGEDELTDIFSDLMTMVGRIHDKEAEFFEGRIKEQKLVNKQQEMEFKMLSSQINPHFLYNTLETIRMQAISSRNREVATSIMLLADSMHYVLENTGTALTTLARELEHVKTYLQIQKLRFRDRVCWDFYLDETVDMDRFVILPLLLQPVVENAIVHGLEGKEEKGHISLIIEREKEDKIIITVKDNGKGIGSEKLEQLGRSIREKSLDDSSSIGLHNIDQRVKLFYGEEYGLTITSELFKGTCVSLVLPFGEDGEG